MIEIEKKESQNTHAESPKIQIHLDGKDFEGFTRRMAGVLVVSLAVTWWTGWDGGLIFLLNTICWLVFFAYKIVQFKEEAYQQVIDDLEAKNSKLEKSNKLLQNVVQDSLGMRVSTKDEK
jgi:cell division protein FtsL